MSKIMNKNELHEYGINLMISYLKKQGYTIIEQNNEIDMNPQIIAQKATDMAFILVRTFMYPKKNVDINDKDIDMVKQGAKIYNAKCYVAKVGLTNAQGNNASELSKAYTDSDFLVKFTGLKEI